MSAIVTALHWVTVPAPLPSLASTRVDALLAELLDAWSPTMVDVDDERLNVLASGARCVSLSSARCVSRGSTALHGHTHSW